MMSDVEGVRDIRQERVRSSPEQDQDQDHVQKSSGRQVTIHAIHTKELSVRIERSRVRSSRSTGVRNRLKDSGIRIWK